MYVAGLSYVNIRTEKIERPSRFALCHAWKMGGFAVILTLYLYMLDDNGNPSANTLQSYYRIIGFILLGTSVIFVFLMAVNEWRQRQGIIYNYRDCLDHENSIANNYCKLFSKNEVIIERNPTVSSAGLWKSTENLLPRSKDNYTNLWTIYLMLPKLHGAVMFHYLLLMFTFAESRGYVDWFYAKGITVWIMVIGAVIGCVILRFVHCAKVYTIMSAIATISIGVSYVFYSNNSGLITIFLWIYFLAVSVCVAVPDLALMEISKIRFCEGALALGHFFEVITMAVLQSTQRNAHVLTTDQDYNDKYFVPTIISTGVILVVTSVLYQLHMPDTFDKSLLQIQNELLKYKKYLVFAFDDEVASAIPQRSSGSDDYAGSNQYMRSTSVNVFEDHARNISAATPNDYTEVVEKDKLPDPPVNRVTNYDYETVRAPAIIPRVNFAKNNPYSK